MTYMITSLRLLDGVKDCCVCGNPTASESAIDLQFTHQEVVSGVLRNRQIDTPICDRCENEWNRAERKVGRDLSGDEFLLWALSEASKGTKRGRAFLETVARLDEVDISGALYADLADAIIKASGKHLKIVCPECGEVCTTHKGVA